MSTRGKVSIGAAVLLAVAVGGVAVGWAARPHDRGKRTVLRNEDTLTGRPDAVSVKTIHPRNDSSFTVSTVGLATVEAFNQVDLKSLVPGTVKYVGKDIDDPVSKGELLVEIDVPDLEREVFLKEKIVDQRLRELQVARAKLRIATAAVDVADAGVEQKRADVKTAEATRDLREKRWHRFQRLMAKESIEPSVVEEEERDYYAAVYAVDSAKAAVKKARADWEEAKANLEAANADVELKQALVEVSRKDRDLARVKADYAKITAPFDGTIIRRHVDLGWFVQAAAGANAEPVMSVARSDLVTVAMHVPDNVAPLVTRNTRAIILMDELPGSVLHARVTRRSPAIRDKDRTMRVEVDLYNGTPEEYRDFVRQGIVTFLTPVGTPRLVPLLTLTAARRDVWGQNMKGTSDPFPVLPRVTGKPLGERRLLPGMTGYMRLLLHRFANTYLLPSGAVVSRGGKPYVVVVQEGKAHFVPVKVYVNDGKLAKVALITREADPRLGQQEVLHELTGEEEIVASRQLELSEGQPVRPTREDWQPAP